jgi:hypothetical protein
MSNNMALERPSRTSPKPSKTAHRTLLRKVIVLKEDPSNIEVEVHFNTGDGFRFKVGNTVQSVCEAFYEFERSYPGLSLPAALKTAVFNPDKLTIKEAVIDLPRRILSLKHKDTILTWRTPRLKKNRVRVYWRTRNSCVPIDKGYSMY